jgi:hypothetical protein
MGGIVRSLREMNTERKIVTAALALLLLAALWLLVTAIYALV